MKRSDSSKNSGKSNLYFHINRVTTFTYKLDDMDAIEETLEQHRRENPGEDEQLLDDF